MGGLPATSPASDVGQAVHKRRWRERRNIGYPTCAPSRAPSRNGETSEECPRRRHARPRGPRRGPQPPVTRLRGTKETTPNLYSPSRGDEALPRRRPRRRMRILSGESRNTRPMALLDTRTVRSARIYPAHPAQVRARAVALEAAPARTRVWADRRKSWSSRKPWQTMTSSHKRPWHRPWPRHRRKPSHRRKR